nr:hypothetical protein [Flavonifractor sp. An135]
MEQKEKAIAHFEKVIRDTDQVLPHCSESLRAELLEQRGYYELALEALRTPQLTGTQEALLRIAREPRMFGGEDGG